jgi:biopolymer transport protein ExbD
MVLFSCGNEKKILLPEIENAKITEVLDVSPAYLFYDETKADSVELNRKNLISTTNWLVNVDKRLKLSQAIPKIQIMQDKKRNAELHKNENAKNYYTCNDTSIKNLGFLEFTEVYYKIQKLKTKPIPKLELRAEDYLKNPSITSKMPVLKIYIQEDGKTYLNGELLDIENALSKITNIREAINAKGFILILWFDKNLSFQDYIHVKSQLTAADSNYITIDQNEFIY